MQHSYCIACLAPNVVNAIRYLYEQQSSGERLFFTTFAVTKLECRLLDWIRETPAQLMDVLWILIMRLANVVEFHNRLELRPSCDREATDSSCRFCATKPIHPAHTFARIRFRFADPTSSTISKPLLDLICLSVEKSDLRNIYLKRK